MNLKDEEASQHDRQLALEAVNGNRDSLEQLIGRHYKFIFNVALKLVVDPSDAEDITQDALVKVVTNLAQFKGTSSFRTWLYRIVVNHFLDLKRRKIEDVYVSFSDFTGSDSLIDISDESLADLTDEEIEETRLLCTTGMLMCLTRDQRLVYVLGDFFEVDHLVGAEILSITPDNFRQRLSRARNDLYSFIKKKCGLINPANPCRCPKKTRIWVDKGLVNKDRLKFNLDHKLTIQELVSEHKIVAGKEAEELKAILYQNHPYQKAKGSDLFLKQLLEKPSLAKLLNWNG